jgi:hypothetical protein
MDPLRLMISLAERSWGANRWASDFVPESGLDSEMDGPLTRETGHLRSFLCTNEEMTFVTKTAR